MGALPSGRDFVLRAAALTAAVEIRVRKRGGRGEHGEVAIAFASLDELEGLISKLRRG